MIIGWSSFKVVQMVPVHCISRSQELKVDFLTKNLTNLLVPNHWTDFNIILQIVPLVILNQDCSRHSDSSKNMAARGRGLFSLCIHIDNFKNLVRNHKTDFNVILQNCSFSDPLPRLFKQFGSVKKHGRYGVGGGGGLFSLYIYIENFKNLLVRNRLTDFHIILQKCSFGDPLPRLFRPFGFVKKHGRQGAGLIFPIYLYRKL